MSTAALSASTLFGPMNSLYSSRCFRPSPMSSWALTDALRPLSLSISAFLGSYPPASAAKPVTGAWLVEGCVLAPAGLVLTPALRVNFRRVTVSHGWLLSPTSASLSSGRLKWAPSSSTVSSTTSTH